MDQRGLNIGKARERVVWLRSAVRDDRPANLEELTAWMLTIAEDLLYVAEHYALEPIDEHTL